MPTYDLCRAAKMEAPATGGTQRDSQLIEINSRQDALSAAALHLQGPSVTQADRQVYVDRDGANLRLSDATTSHVLGELVSATTGQNGSHDALRDLSHFMGDQGPSYGLGNAVCARNFSGPLLTSEVWYTSAAMTTKIVSKTLAYASGSPVPSTITWAVYSATGGIIRTCVDTLLYAGPVAYQVNRQWS